MPRAAMLAARRSHESQSGSNEGGGSRRPLPISFFSRPSAVVARALLGTILECDTGRGRASGRIVETEAYLGPDDPASHAAAGLTPRTLFLFGPPGTSYVYRSYGIHWCFNAVTGHRGSGTAVLVRAIEPLDGIELMRRRRRPAGAKSAPRVSGERQGWELTNGPGKLCAALGIDGGLSGLVLRRPPLILRRGVELSDSDVVVSPRIGITKATAAELRYFVRDNPFVSRTPTRFVKRPYRVADSDKNGID